MTVLMAVINILIAPRVGVEYHGSVTTAHSHAYFVGDVILTGVIDTALWLWMAWKSRSGRSWARTVSTVLFGFFCLGTLIAVVSDSAAFKILHVVTWLVALAAIILLWQPESDQFFRATRTPTAYGPTPPWSVQLQPYGRPPGYATPPPDEPPDAS
jgi:hypothetical protein